MRILITGGSGQLGAYVIEKLLSTRHEFRAWSGSETGQRFGVALTPVDLTDPLVIEKSLEEFRPDTILHAAAISSAEAVRAEPGRARVINVEATKQIAIWAERNGRRLIFTSTDLVFDGSRPWNREDDPAAPSLIYGKTKVEAEAAVLAAPGGLVARLPLLFGLSTCGKPSFFSRAIDSIRDGVTQSFFEDEFRTPLHYATAARILVDLIDSELAGLYHVAGAERLSRFEMMRRAVEALGLDVGLVASNKLADQKFAEPRPLDASLDTTKLAAQFPDLKRPSIEEALS